MDTDNATNPSENNTSALKFKERRKFNPWVRLPAYVLFNGPWAAFVWFAGMQERYQDQPAFGNVVLFLSVLLMVLALLGLLATFDFSAHASSRQKRESAEELSHIQEKQREFYLKSPKKPAWYVGMDWIFDIGVMAMMAWYGWVGCLIVYFIHFWALQSMFSNIETWWSIEEKLRKEGRARQEPPNGEEWEVWCEGYVATGQRAGATLIGRVPKSEAKNFDQAIYRLIDNGTLNESLVLHEGEEEGDPHWSLWGCRIYDNEADARKSFG